MQMKNMTTQQLIVKKAELSAKAIEYANKRDKTRSLLERKKHEIYRRSTCEQIGKVQELIKKYRVETATCKNTC
jgi:hypothetical protein